LLNSIYFTDLLKSLGIYILYIILFKVLESLVEELDSDPLMQFVLQKDETNTSTINHPGTSNQLPLDTVPMTTPMSTNTSQQLAPNTSCPSKKRVRESGNVQAITPGYSSSLDTGDNTHGELGGSKKVKSLNDNLLDLNQHSPALKANNNATRTHNAQIYSPNYTSRDVNLSGVKTEFSNNLCPPISSNSLIQKTGFNNIRQNPISHTSIPSATGFSVNGVIHNVQPYIQSSQTAATGFGCDGLIPNLQPGIMSSSTAATGFNGNGAIPNLQPGIKSSSTAATGFNGNGAIPNLQPGIMSSSTARAATGFNGNGPIPNLQPCIVSSTVVPAGLNSNSRGIPNSQFSTSSFKTTPAVCDEGIYDGMTTSPASQQINDKNPPFTCQPNPQMTNPDHLQTTLSYNQLEGLATSTEPGGQDLNVFLIPNTVFPPASVSPIPDNGNDGKGFISTPASGRICNRSQITSGSALLAFCKVINPRKEYDKIQKKLLGPRRSEQRIQGGKVRYQDALENALLANIAFMMLICQLKLTIDVAPCFV
jgi:hypothetical protein